MKHKHKWVISPYDWGYICKQCLAWTLDKKQVHEFVEARQVWSGNEQ